MEHYSTNGFPKMTTAKRDAATAANRLPVPCIIENTSFTPTRLQMQVSAGVWQDLVSSGVTPAQQFWQQ
jgi:hypothetical protein